MRNQFSGVRVFTRGLNGISRNLEPLSYLSLAVRALGNGLDEGSFAALKAGVISLWARGVEVHQVEHVHSCLQVPGVGIFALSPLKTMPSQAYLVITLITTRTIITAVIPYPQALP